MIPLLLALSLTLGQTYWQVWEQEPDMEPDRGYLYDIMWEQPASWPVMGQDAL